MNPRTFYIDEFMSQIEAAYSASSPEGEAPKPPASSVEEEEEEEEEETSPEPEAEEEEETEELDEAGELDVQKAVVESLAADKVKLEKEIADSAAEIDSLKAAVSERDEKIARLEKEAEEARSKPSVDAQALADVRKEAEEKIRELENRIAELQEKEFDAQERNPNALALLDREPELPDRFPGETRDQVIEVLREGLKAAEAGGRLRRMQILESVLVANEPNGNLAKKREEIERLFADNGNILSGEVIEELKNRGISCKAGEDYLMPSEIIDRNF